MKKIILLFSLLTATIGMTAQTIVEDIEGRPTDYVNSIRGRARKIIDKLGIDDTTKANMATIVLTNRYFKLNDIYAERDTLIARAKRTLKGSEKNKAIQEANNQCESRLYKSHFEFPATLSLFLTPEQVDGVKDGMTFNVVKVTYDAHIEMIPSLTDEEKQQIMAWLIEAREFAIDAESSKKKHEWFGKYKGRINNYLSKRGYDLTKEREEWYKRIGKK